MRKETIQAIKGVINEYDNACQYYGDSFDNYFGTTDLNEVADIVYQDVIEYSEEVSGYSKAIRFDGKKTILEFIKKEIVSAEYEYLNR